MNVGLLLRKATLALNRVSGTVPKLRLVASRLDKPTPLPLNAVAVTVPFTSSAEAGLFFPMPTPPVARIRNWLLAVLMKSEYCWKSAQTKVPG